MVMKNLLIVPLILVLAGCANPKKLETYSTEFLYMQAHNPHHSPWTPSRETKVEIVRELIKREGLTQEEALECSRGGPNVGWKKGQVRLLLGLPQDTENHTSEFGTTSVWWYGYYPNLTMIRFGTDGRVSHISH